MRVAEWTLGGHQPEMPKDTVKNRVARSEEEDVKIAMEDGTRRSWATASREGGKRQKPITASSAPTAALAATSRSDDASPGKVTADFKDGVLSASGQDEKARPQQVSQHLLTGKVQRRAASAGRVTTESQTQTKIKIQIKPGNQDQKFSGVNRATQFAFQSPTARQVSPQRRL
jgi:hypothetical protein